MDALKRFIVEEKHTPSNFYWLSVYSLAAAVAGAVPGIVNVNGHDVFAILVENREHLNAMFNAAKEISVTLGMQIAESVGISSQDDLQMEVGIGGFDMIDSTVLVYYEEMRFAPLSEDERKEVGLMTFTTPHVDKAKLN